uniref:Uncharacterized protein n=1 Tax=Lepeophtheirus salmonis TaxID=72036 RepID=A0A0K2VK37_LEPSM
MKKKVPNQVVVSHLLLSMGILFRMFLGERLGNLNFLQRKVSK